MFILLIFSLLTATFSVVDRNAVESSGELPKGSLVSYWTSATTGQKGQLTGTNTLRLSLIGWEGTTLRRVALTMHSNAHAGAGSLEMRVGVRKVWQIADNDYASVAWNDHFSTAWDTIAHSMNVGVGKGDTIVVEVTASKSSLYVGSFTFWYEGRDSEWKQDSCATDTLVSIRPKQSGRYRLGYDVLGDITMWNGTIDDGHIATWQPMAHYADSVWMVTDTVTASSVYEVTFLTDSTLTIRHAASGQWIGCTTKGMKAQQTVFRYDRMEDGAVSMYIVANGKCYYLFPTFGPQMQYDNRVVMPVVLTRDSVEHGWQFFVPIDEAYPERVTVEQVRVPNTEEEKVVPFGMWEIVIRKGKKFVRYVL